MPHQAPLRSILVLLLTAATVSAQEECDSDFRFILQDKPVDAPFSQSEELDVNAIEEDLVFLSDIGSRTEKTLYLGIVSEGKRPTGVQGWSLSLMFDGDVMPGTSRTASPVTGFAAAPVTQGGLFDGGFEKTSYHTVDPDTITSGVVLSFVKDITLAPRGTATIMQFAVQPRKPLEEDPAVGELRFETAINAGYIPVSTVMTVEGGPVHPCTPTIGVRFVPTRIRRADSNADFRIDITDAIIIFQWLFLGGRQPECLDAADTDDSGAIDLTDGLLILLDFFRPDTGIADPGPFRCGFDPTPDDLPCDVPTPCP